MTGRFVPHGRRAGCWCGPLRTIVYCFTILTFVGVIWIWLRFAGTLKTASSAYDRAMELKVATPQMVINYADMLDQNKYWEQSFKVFERGIAMFDFPHVQEIWLQYLWKFIQRYELTASAPARA